MTAMDWLASLTTPDIIGLALLSLVATWLVLGLATMLAVLYLHPPKGFFRTWSWSWRAAFVGALLICAMAGPVAMRALVQTMRADTLEEDD